MPVLTVINWLFQAGGMSRAKNLAKLQDEEREGKLGYVFAVSGPGEFVLSSAYQLLCSS